MNRTKITAVFGTRPEAIKMCPLILELRKIPSFDVRVTVSGQHRELCGDVLDFFNITPDSNFNIMSCGQTLFDITDKIISAVRDEFSANTPDILLVHGDTATAFSAALAAFYMGIKIGHIEAGLRSNDIFAPYPEEFYRRAIDAASFLHFCPTDLSRKNLLLEGMNEERIFVTGNTVIDALVYTLDGYMPTHDDSSIKLIVTLHRRESRGAEMRNVLRAIRHAAQKYDTIQVIFPAHPAKEVGDAISDTLLSGDTLQNIRVIPPQPVRLFHRMLSDADLILTDSGGLQEEAAALGKPLLLVRNTTERPEGIDSGTIIPVGTDEESVFSALCEMIDSPERRKKAAESKNPFGDGRACERISKILLSFFS